MIPSASDHYFDAAASQMYGSSNVDHRLPIAWFVLLIASSAPYVITPDGPAQSVSTEHAAILFDYFEACPLIAEGFTPRLRYSGSSIGYQLALLTAGGPAPIIATALLATYHSGYVIAGYIAVCAIVSIIATALMPD